MLKSDFYYLQSQEVIAGTLTSRITLNPAHPIFEGHFPGQPVVPGVCMIQIVKELLEAHSGKRLLLQQAGQVKFLQLLQPVKEEVVDVNISWKDAADGAFMVTADFKKDGTALFKLSAIFSLHP